MQYTEYTFFWENFCAYVTNYVFSPANKCAAAQKHLDKSSAKLYHMRRWICTLSEFEFVLLIGAIIYD